MMPGIFGIGIDIVEIERMASLRQRHGERFKSMLFLPGEAEYCLGRVNPDECFAARFAAKEAVMKALGTGWSEEVTFTGIEVVRRERGAPAVRLHGPTAELARRLGAGRIHLTLSHSRVNAIAQVLIETA